MAQLPPRPPTGTKTAAKKPPNPITLSENALAHLRKLRAEQGGEGLLLRMGVKSGGCSGAFGLPSRP